MSKINLDTFKKLLSVKKGGAEFFRFIIKAMFWIFAIGAIFYGLIWVPNQELNIQIAKANIEVVKVQRGCEVGARNSTLNALNLAKKEEKEVTKEQERNFFLRTFNDCVALQGMDFLIQNLPAKKEAKK